MKLEDLLDEAVQRATTVVRDKAEKVGLTEQEIVDNGRYVGIGAVKYADLSTSAVRDYKFDLDQMVSLNGDTSVYLQYAYARIQSILRKALGEFHPQAHPELELAPAERALGLHLDQFSEVVTEAAKEYAPTNSRRTSTNWPPPSRRSTTSATSSPRTTPPRWSKTACSWWT